jgi:hypothetical protein
MIYFFLDHLVLAARLAILRLFLADKLGGKPHNFSLTVATSLFDILNFPFD